MDITCAGDNSATLEFSPSIRSPTRRSPPCKETVFWRSALTSAATSSPPSSVSSAALTAGVPGDWILRKNGVDSGWFNTQITTPFADNDPSQPINVPLAKIRLTVDANQQLTKVEVGWWSYDTASATYVAATSDADLQMIGRLIGGGYEVWIGQVASGNTVEEDPIRYFVREPPNRGQRLCQQLAGEWRCGQRQAGGRTVVHQLCGRGTKISFSIVAGGSRSSQDGASTTKTGVATRATTGHGRLQEPVTDGTVQCGPGVNLPDEHGSLFA